MMCSAGRGFHICQGKLENCFPIHSIRAPDTQYSTGQRSQMESSSSSSHSSKLKGDFKRDILAEVKRLQLNLMQPNTSYMFKENYVSATRVNKSNIIKWFIIYIFVFYCCFLFDPSFILSYSALFMSLYQM